MKKIYLFSVIAAGILGHAAAQNPVKISADLGSSTQITVSGTTAGWFTGGNPNTAFVSVNKQKAAGPLFTNPEAFDKVIASDKYVGYLSHAGNKSKFFVTDGTSFASMFSDSTTTFRFGDIYNDQIFTYEIYQGLEYAIAVRNGLNGTRQEITKKAFKYAQSKGYLHWAQQNDTIGMRKPDGSISYITGVSDDVQNVFASGSRVAWVQDGITRTVRFSDNGAAAVTVGAVKSLDTKLAFLGDDKLIVSGDSIRIYQIKPTVQLLKEYALKISLSKKDGTVAANSGGTAFFITTTGDTSRIAENVDWYDVSGENVIRLMKSPVISETLLKWYKNGIYQKDVFAEADHGAITISEFAVSEKSVVWRALHFTPLEKTGIYLYEFEPGVPTTGFEDIKMSSRVQVYPNPASDILNIQSDVTLSNHIEIYNIRGELVRSEKYNGTEINISALKAGIYFIEMKDGQGVLSHARFIKR